MVTKEMVEKLSNSPNASDYLDALKALKEGNLGFFDEDTGEIAFTDETTHLRIFVTFGQHLNLMKYQIFFDTTLLANKTIDAIVKLVRSKARELQTDATPSKSKSAKSKQKPTKRKVPPKSNSKPNIRAKKLAILDEGN